MNFDNINDSLIDTSLNNSPNARNHSLDHTDSLNTGFLSPYPNNSATGNSNSQFSSFINQNQAHHNNNTSITSYGTNDLSLSNIVLTDVFQNTPYINRTNNNNNNSNNNALSANGSGNVLSGLTETSPLNSYFQNGVCENQQQQHMNLGSGVTNQTIGSATASLGFALGNSTHVMESPNTFFNNIVILSPPSVNRSKQRLLIHPQVDENEENCKISSALHLLNNASGTNNLFFLRSPLKEIHNSNSISPTASKTAKAAANAFGQKVSKISLKTPSKKKLTSALSKDLRTPLRSNLNREDLINLEPDKSLEEVNSSPTTIINSSARKAEAEFDHNSQSSSAMILLQSSPTRTSGSSSPSQIQPIPNEPKLGTFNLQGLTKKTSTNKNGQPKNKKKNFAPLNIIMTNCSTFEQLKQDKENNLAGSKNSTTRKTKKGTLKRAKTLNGETSSSGMGSMVGRLDLNSAETSTGPKKRNTKTIGVKNKLKRSISQPMPILNNTITNSNNIDPTFTQLIDDSSLNMVENIDNKDLPVNDSVGMIKFKSVVNDQNPNIRDVFRD